MKLAEKQASKAIFITGDNPQVGCVIVKNNEVVGNGFTQEPGGAHAEIMALNEAGDKAQGCLLYTSPSPRD